MLAFNVYIVHRMPVTSYGSVPGDFSDLESAVADNNALQEMTPK